MSCSETSCFQEKDWAIQQIPFSDYVNHLPQIAILNNEFVSPSTSKGNQCKWYIADTQMYVKGPFTYQDREWKDYICEDVARHISAQLQIPLAMGSACVVILPTGKSHLGSMSKSFLSNSETFIPFATLLRSSRLHAPKIEWERLSTTDRIQYCLEIYRNICGLDATMYIWSMIALDYLIGNEDRHMNNFGVVQDVYSGYFRFPPMFDNGLSLFEHDERYLAGPLYKHIQHMKGKPFNTNLQKSYQVACTEFNQQLSGALCLDGMILPSMHAWYYLAHVLDATGIKYFGTGRVIA